MSKRVKLATIELWGETNDEDTQNCVNGVVSHLLYSDFIKNGTIKPKVSTIMFP